MIFTTAITADYLGRAAPLLASLHRLDFPAWVVTLNFANMPRGRGYRTVPMSSPYRCSQQGQVLDVLEVEETETLVQMDADAVIQRDLTEEEETLLQVGPGAIGLGPNGAGDTGEVEYHRLLPLHSLEEVNRCLDLRLDQVPVFNAGFIAACPSVWRELRKTYELLYAAGAHLFANWRCCQLLLCCAVWQLGLEVVKLPRTLHAHQHFRAAREDTLREGKLYVGDQLVFFAHHIPGLVGV